MSSEGHYVTIPAGSNYYIYDNGRDISGWSYAEFAALIGGVAAELNYEPSQDIKAAFTEHFDGWDESYRGGITPPERAEIFCQCVDSRIDTLELTAALHEAAQEWADDFDTLRTCKYCNTEYRPYLYDDDTPYVCSDDDCELQAEANRYEIPVTELKRAKEFDDFDDEWDHIVEHGSADILTEDG